MPITFVYNQTTLTTKGHKAAAQIAQYLIARRSKTALLSGHADERGSDLYNMQLSRARLQVVAYYLREQGFSGQLELQAKGKSEPFAGVDRRSLSREQAFELDRRVELRVAN
jgi:outer membrane protein OmpA-like peptidoglycan-associated protein